MRAALSFTRHRAPPTPGIPVRRTFSICSNPLSDLGLCGYAMAAEVDPSLDLSAAPGDDELVHLLVEAMPVLKESRFTMWSDDPPWGSGAGHWQAIPQLELARRVLVHCCWRNLAYSSTQEMPYAQARDHADRFIRTLPADTRILTNASLHQVLDVDGNRDGGYSSSNVVTSHTFEVDVAFFTGGMLYLFVFIAED